MTEASPSLIAARARVIVMSRRAIRWSLASECAALLMLAIAWSAANFWLYALCVGFSLLMTGAQLRLQRIVIVNTDPDEAGSWMLPLAYTLLACGTALFAWGVVLGINRV